MRIPNKKLLTRAAEINGKRLRVDNFSKNIYYFINDRGIEIFQIEILPPTTFCIRGLYLKELRPDLIFFKKGLCLSIIDIYKDFINNKGGEINIFFDSPYGCQTINNNKN